MYRVIKSGNEFLAIKINSVYEDAENIETYLAEDTPVILIADKELLEEYADVNSINIKIVE